MADQFYESKIETGVQGNTVVVLDHDADGRDPRILLRLSPEAARRLGRELLAGAEQCCDT